MKQGILRWTKWSPGFALFPRRLVDGRLVWLRKIEYRSRFNNELGAPLADLYSGYAGVEGGYEWQYREPPPCRRGGRP